MVSSLADLCVKCLCRTGYELSPTGISFPLPSIAESILLDSSSPRRLPIPITNALFEGLARRRKLTEPILRVFLDPTRAMLTSLPLTFVRSMPHGVGERSFEHRIRQRKFLRHVDVSFSNCISEHPFSLVDAFSRTCRDTLLSFSASHVTGHLGVLRLKEFTRLRHVDLGYTSTSSTDIESLCASLSQLRHLDVSGTTASWYQVFCSVKRLSELEHLGMSDLKFLTANEWDIVSRRNVSATWIADLFSTMTQLSSLDISNVKWDALQRSVLEATFRQIVTGAQSLTRLEASFPDLHEVVAVLESSERLEQMRYLAFHGEATWIPDVLSNGRLRFIFCSHGNAENIDFVNVSLKGGFDFQMVAMTLPHLVVDSGMNSMDRRDVLFRVMSAAVTVARLKLFCAKNDRSPVERFLVNVICLRTPYKTRCLACSTRIPGCFSYACPEHFSDPSVNELWEEMIDCLLEASLTRPDVFFRTYNNLVWALCAALLSRPPVLSVALPFFLNAITRKGAATRNLFTTCGSCSDSTPMLAGLTSIFESLDEFERSRFALHTKWLARVCDQMEQISSLGDLSCNDELSPPLNRDIRLLLDILYYMCRDLPDAQQRLVQETNLLALLPSYVPLLWKECRMEVSKSVAMSSLRLLIALAENESLRHRVLSKSSLQMLLDCSPCFESSYLTCLLLLCEDAHWPANVLSKDATAHRMVTLRFGILMSFEGDIQRYRYSNGTCACLRDMGQRTDVPSPVGWFGQYVLSMMEEDVVQVS
ncbi:uncharacterized protein [Oscarella lobularis]|uniref:uncharacterized protein n=1 Tax=Oscarella lobularis TaxID=121494 RepID=UPI00331369E6